MMPSKIYRYLEVLDQDDIRIFRLYGRANDDAQNELERAFFHALKDGKKQVLVDLSKVLSINSTMLGILVMALQKIKQMHGRLILACLQPSVRHVFDVTNLVRVFETYDAIEEARAAFRS